MQVSKLLHALINWNMCLHHFQVQSGYLSASTWLPGNHIVFIFPRIFQMSHQLKYFPLVRQWLDLPQRLQWEHAATTSPWQVLSFAPINTSSLFDQRIGVKWTFLLKRSNHILPWIFATPGQTGTDPPSICGTNTGYHSELKSIEQYSKQYQQSNPPYLISVNQYQQSNLHYLISVCWIWRKLDGLDKSDVHVRVDHFCQDLECPASSDFLHGFL